MIYGSVCSGIEAASVAWKPLAWHCAFVSEIEPFPSTLLKQHYPDTPNYGDLNEFTKWPQATVDLLVGGTPCQSFSVAGLRKGMDDPRGNLTLVYLAAVDRFRPRWMVWENVPGILSIDGGRAFGAFLGGLGQLGYGFAYRILDAQYFGVPQRRRRVFVVGHFGDWRRAAAVLFERESLRGNPPPSRAKGQGVAGPIAGCSNAGGPNGLGRTADDADSLIAKAVRTPTGGIDREDMHTLIPDIAWALQQRDSKGADSDTKVGHLIPVLEVGARTGRIGHEDRDGLGMGEPDDPMFTLQGGKQHDVMAFESRFARNAGGQVGVAFKASHYTCGKDGAPSEVTPPLGVEADKGDQDLLVRSAMTVRRLTPRECERLQGFPDDYTLVTYRGKPAADGPRYKALGNSMAVPVMRWIGSRIQMMEEIA